MNMKQSCKALICAIEGELDGRHCTEEQAAAILDHAVPSLTEALARVEAERDSLMETYVALAEKLGIDLDAARKAPGKPSDVFVSYISGIQAQLAEAVGLLEPFGKMAEGKDRWPETSGVAIFPLLSQVRPVRAFLNRIARHAQVEQQEAQGAKPRGGRYCRSCGTHLCVKGVCTIYCPNKNCEKDRHALATQPAAGEPVAINVNYADEVDLIRAVLEGYSPSIARADALCSVKLLKAYFAAPPAAAPIVVIEPVAWARQCDIDENDPAIFVAREEVQESGYDIPLYMSAPPAAAHGDEAVLWELLDKSVYGSDEQQVVARAKIRRLLAMRAQGDGGDV